MEINGKNLKKIDFEKEWTYRQDKKARELLLPFYKSMPATGENASENELAEAGTNLLYYIMENNIDAEILALLYLNEDENKFNEKTYKDRVELIKEAFIYQIEEMKAETFSDFFGKYGILALGGSQTFLNHLTGGELEKKSSTTQ